MKEFNKRIDDLVKFAISAKQLAVQYPNDMELGKEIRKLILKEKNDLFSNKTKESV
jgi:hypothetical protein